MIVQAIGLLDDLDKELNTYAMRVREWYGWHFPEMTKIVADNIKYAKAVCSSSLLLHRAEWCVKLEWCETPAMLSLSTLYGFLVADLCCLCPAAYVLPRFILQVSSCVVNDSEHQTSKIREWISLALSSQFSSANEAPVTENTYSRSLRCCDSYQCLGVADQDDGHTRECCSSGLLRHPFGGRGGVPPEGCSCHIHGHRNQCGGHDEH